MSGNKTYKIKYALSIPERTSSGRAVSSRDIASTFTVSAPDIKTAKQQLKISKPYRQRMERASSRLDFQEHRKPRLTIDKITEKSGKSKEKVVQESSRNRRIFGGGRAAGVDATVGRGSKGQLKNKLMPNT